MRELGADVLGWNTQRLVIESREGRDGHDRQALFEVLRNCPDVRYEHQMPHSEPALWVAGAIAWCYGAGDVWRQRVSPLVTAVRDVGQV